MLRNHLKIALRSLWKQKGITAINILGLAAGMSVCLLVGLLFWDQLTHDDFHPGADRLYRVTIDVEKGANYAATPIDLAPALRSQVAGVEAVTRLKRTRQNVAVENQGYEAEGYYAEPSFFDVFGFELIAGSEEEVLAAPYSAVISQQLARRLYGEDDPVGKTFHLGTDGPFTVTGVMDRDAYRSHLRFDVLYSFASTKSQDQRLGTEYTYLRLRSGYAPEDVAPSLRQVEAQHLPDESMFLDDARPNHFRLQALSEIPLSRTTRLLNDNAGSTLPPTVAYFLAALAAIVLLGAGFNYVNLSTARSLARAREVGVRKTMGAHREQVMGQFVAEGVLVSLLALGLAVVFLEALVPTFNRLSVVREMGVPIEIEPGLLLYGTFLLFATLVGLVAGLYPAWHLSRFQPSRVLKASAQSRTPGFEWITLRKVLIVLQFAVAFVIIATTALLYQQVQHVAEAEGTGIRTDRLVHVRLQDVPYATFRQEARQVPGVERVAGASHVPLSGTRTTGVLVESDLVPDSMSSGYYAVDYEFVEVMDLPFLATQDWSEEGFEGGQAVLMNETAARQLGFREPKDALGQPLTLQRFRTSWTVRVAGIVQDFYFAVSREPSRPLVFHYNPDWFQVALARVTSAQEQSMLATLEETWRQFDSTNPANIQLHESLRRDEVAGLKDGGTILAFVAGLAVLISCLGLLGIATYTVQTRTHEIGIRKALGATVPSLVSLLSRDFLWLIAAAVALGLPVGWWLNRLWLRSYAYRIELGVWTFILSAAGLLVLALLAIGSQTVRAARLDPSTVLRDE